MNKKILCAALICAGLTAGSTARGQNYPTVKALISSEGSFTQSLRNQKISVPDIEMNLNTILNLNQDFTFEKIKEKSNSVHTHITYQQFYKGYKIDHALVLVHIKNGLVTSINGKIMQVPDEAIILQPSISSERAFDISKNNTGIVKTINTYFPELVIDISSTIPTLAYKVKIDGINTANRFNMYEVYVDAVSGVEMKKYPLIKDVDVPATAETFYSGTQTIITDLFEEDSYRLRDSARRIETYDGTSAIPVMDESSGILFEDAADITNNSTTWGESLNLMTVKLDAFANPETTDKLGINFDGQNVVGNLLHVIIEDITPGGAVTVKETFAESTLDLPPISLPIQTNNLLVSINGSQYTVTLRVDSISINIFSQDAQLQIISYDTPSVISFNVTNSIAGTYDWNDGDNNGSYVIAFAKNPAIDVHWGIEQTYDFYKNKFGYYSYDNDSTSILKNYYNGVYNIYGTQNNAAAVPPPFNAMVYGTGDAVDFGPFANTDVTGHEYTHLITEHNAQLVYQGESGALNEAFSDMMGAAIEFYAKPDSANWNIGEGICLTMPYFRSMSDPKSTASFNSPYATAQPNTYKGQYWLSTSSQEDNGGVHINSGVGNKWFYLLAEGGSGTNDNGFTYNITGIGLEKATEIAFNAFTNYLTSNAQYIDAYNGTLEAGADLYGENSTEYNTVKAAWNAVGIPASNTSVNNIKLYSNISVYPNPSSGKFEINSRLNTKAQVAIYNVTGVKLRDMEVKPGANYIDLSSLSKGVYLIEFRAGNESYSQKVVLQ